MSVLRRIWMTLSGILICKFRWSLGCLGLVLWAFRGLVPFRASETGAEAK